MWRKRDGVLDDETLDGIIEKLMEIDAKLESLLDHFELSDDDEEEADDA